MKTFIIYNLCLCVTSILSGVIMILHNVQIGYVCIVISILCGIYWIKGLKNIN